MSSYQLVVDQSTTSTKAFLYDTKGSIIQQAQRTHQQFHPQTGWVEQDAQEIYLQVIEVMEELLQSIKESDKVLGLSLTNQRETIVMWDKDHHEPLYHAIVWQCRRSEALCKAMKEQEEMIIEKTGLRLDPYFSATKMKWLLDHKANKNQNIAFGTMDSWLIYKLTGKHICDHTNASRTMLYNIQTNTWDDDLLQLFQIPKDSLPSIVQSDADFGKVTIGNREIPIISVMGDSQSAFFAHEAHTLGDVKITLGTGCSMMMNQGSKPPKRQHGVVAAIAYAYDNRIAYAGEAVIRSCSDTLNWLKEELNLYQEDTSLNHVSMDSHGVVFVPAFAGLGIPYWNINAKAMILGLTRSTTKEDILSAALNSIVYQVCDALTCLQESAGCKIQRISIDGGASNNQQLMQRLSDISQKTIHVYQGCDFSAHGVYQMALEKLAISLPTRKHKVITYTPKIASCEAHNALEEWHKAIQTVLYDAKGREA